LSACRYIVFPAIFVKKAVFSPSYVLGVKGKTFSLAADEQ
jgi:hypothetical protein